MDPTLLAHVPRKVSKLSTKPEMSCNVGVTKVTHPRLVGQKYSRLDLTSVPKGRSKVCLVSDKFRHIARNARVGDKIRLNDRGGQVEVRLLDRTRDRKEEASETSCVRSSNFDCHPGNDRGDSRREQFKDYEGNASEAVYPRCSPPKPELCSQNQNLYSTDISCTSQDYCLGDRHTPVGVIDIRPRDTERKYSEPVGHLVAVAECEIPGFTPGDTGQVLDIQPTIELNDQADYDPFHAIAEGNSLATSIISTDTNDRSVGSRDGVLSPNLPEKEETCIYDEQDETNTSIENRTSNAMTGVEVNPSVVENKYCFEAQNRPNTQEGRDGSGVEIKEEAGDEVVQHQIFYSKDLGEQGSDTCFAERSVCAGDKNNADGWVGMDYSEPGQTDVTDHPESATDPGPRPVCLVSNISMGYSEDDEMGVAEHPQPTSDPGPRPVCLVSHREVPPANPIQKHQILLMEPSRSHQDASYTAVQTVWEDKGKIMVDGVEEEAELYGRQSLTGTSELTNENFESTNNRFECLICGYTSPDRDVMRGHVQSHIHKSCTPSNSQTGDSDISQGSQESGQLFKFTSNGFECFLCGYTNPDEDAMRSHMQNHVIHKSCNQRNSLTGDSDIAPSSHEGNQSIGVWNVSQSDTQISEQKCKQFFGRRSKGSHMFDCYICGYTCNCYTKMKRHVWVHVAKKTLAQLKTQTETTDTSLSTKERSVQFRDEIGSLVYCPINQKPSARMNAHARDIDTLLSTPTGSGHDRGEIGSHMQCPVSQKPNIRANTHTMDIDTSRNTQQIGHNFRDGIESPVLCQVKDEPIPWPNTQTGNNKSLRDEIRSQVQCHVRDEPISWPNIQTGTSSTPLNTQEGNNHYRDELGSYGLCLGNLKPISWATMSNPSCHISHKLIAQPNTQTGTRNISLSTREGSGQFRDEIRGHALNSKPDTRPNKKTFASDTSLYTQEERSHHINGIRGHGLCPISKEPITQPSVQTGTTEKPLSTQEGGQFRDEIGSHALCSTGLKPDTQLDPKTSDCDTSLSTQQGISHYRDDTRSNELCPNNQKHITEPNTHAGTTDKPLSSLEGSGQFRDEIGSHVQCPFNNMPLTQKNIETCASITTLSIQAGLGHSRDEIMSDVQGAVNQKPETGTDTQAGDIGTSLNSQKASSHHRTDIRSHGLLRLTDHKPTTEPSIHTEGSDTSLNIQQGHSHHVSDITRLNTQSVCSDTSVNSHGGSSHYADETMGHLQCPVNEEPDARPGIQTRTSDTSLSSQEGSSLCRDEIESPVNTKPDPRPNTQPVACDTSLKSQDGRIHHCNDIRMHPLCQINHTAIIRPNTEKGKGDTSLGVTQEESSPHENDIRAHELWCYINHKPITHPNIRVRDSDRSPNTDGENSQNKDGVGVHVHCPVTTSQPSSQSGAGDTSLSAQGNHDHHKRRNGGHFKYKLPDHISCHFKYKPPSTQPGDSSASLNTEAANSGVQLDSTSDTGQPTKRRAIHQQYNAEEDEEKQYYKRLPGYGFECLTCGFKTQRSRQIIREHVRIHTGSKPHVCSYCPRAFAQIMDFRRHVARHQAKPHKCEKCDARFAYYNEKQRHLREDHQHKSFVCKICDMGFNTSRNLEEHIARHTGEKPYMCDICGKRVISQRYMDRHMLSHSNPVQCHICGKRFPDNSAVKKHLRTHDSVKQYLCDRCGCGVQSPLALRRHLLKHQE